MRSQGRGLFEVISRWHGEPLGYCTVAVGEELALSAGPGRALGIPGALFGGAEQLLRVEEAGPELLLPAGAELTLVAAHGPSTTVRGVGQVLRLPAGAAAEVRHGALSLELRATGSPERVAALGPLRWREQRATAFSAVLHLLVIGLVAAVPPDGLALTTDHFDRPYRYVATTVKATDKEIPAWLTRATSAPAGGKAAPGPRGKMGDPKAPKRPRRYVVKGDASHSMPVGVPDVTRIGALAALNSSRYASLILDPSKSALGADAEQALGNLVADESGPAYGVNGLSIDGIGRGGGCENPEDCGTVGEGGGDLGRIGWALHPGGGPSWQRGLPERKRTRAPGPPQVFAGVAKLKGALSKEIIRRVVRQHLNEVRYCYERELQQQRRLSGRVVVQFVITGNGRVALSRVAQSTLSAQDVERCVAEAVRRWEFPAPEGRGIVNVSYPFVFHVAGR